MECVNFRGMDLGLQLQMAAEATLHITPHGGVAYSLLFSRAGSSSIVLVDSMCNAKDIYILPNMPWLHVMYLHRAEEHLMHVHVMQGIVQASLRLGMHVPSFDFDAAEPFLRQRLAAHAAEIDEARRARAAREQQEIELMNAAAMQLAEDVKQSRVTTTSLDVDGNGGSVQLVAQINANCAMFSNVSIFCWGQLFDDSDPQFVRFWPVSIQARGIYIGKVHLVHSYTVYSKGRIKLLLCGHHVDSSSEFEIDRATSKGNCIEIRPKDHSIDFQDGENTVASMYELTQEQFAQLFVGIHGFDYACVTMRISGELQCIGNNDQGQLGDGTLEFRYWFCPPHSMNACSVPLPQPVIAVSIGSVHACAVAAEGAVYVRFKHYIRALLTIFQLLLGLQRRRTAGGRF